MSSSRIHYCYIILTKECKKQLLSFPPPWEFQTPISSLRAPDPYLLLEDPVLLLNLPRNLLCQFSSVQLLSHVRLFATPWTAAYQASLSITNSQSLPMNIHGWFPLGWSSLISLQSKGLSSLLRHHSSKASILRHQSFWWSSSHICTWVLEKQ